MDCVSFLRRRLLHLAAGSAPIQALTTHEEIRAFVDTSLTTFVLFNLTDDEFAHLLMSIDDYRNRLGS